MPDVAFEKPILVKEHIPLAKTIVEEIDNDKNINKLCNKILDRLGFERYESYKVVECNHIKSCNQCVMYHVERSKAFVIKENLKNNLDMVT